MFTFIGIIGFLGFLAFMVIAIISGVRRTGKAKKQFKIAGILFIVFIIGMMNTPSSDESAAEKTASDTVKTETNKDKTKEKKKIEIPPSTVAEVQSVIKVGMDFDKYNKVKENKLNVKQPESLSIGNGNVGSVLQATDGLVVVGTDGLTVLSMQTFDSMDQAKVYADKLNKEAKAKKIAEKEKKFQDSKIKLSGSGDSATEMISLDGGFVVFEGTYKGSSNFIVQLMDEAGNDIELLINEIGSYNGKTMAIINTPGKYYLNVKASSSWNFSIYQTLPATIKEVPTEIKGRGDDVVFVNASSGNYKFTSSHQGSSNFIVRLNGSGLLVNEIGNYNGSTRQQLTTDGAYAIVVNADGNWSIKIEE